MTVCEVMVGGIVGVGGGNTGAAGEAAAIVPPPVDARGTVQMPITRTLLEMLALVVADMSTCFAPTKVVVKPTAKETVRVFPEI